VAEYLAPGVYVEEVSFRAKSIEGVGTSTAAFVGPARRGPEVTNPDDPDQAPDLLTSFGDFERIYGGTGDLSVSGSSLRNHLALAVQAFFNNGGSRLYVARVSLGGAAGTASAGVAGTWRGRFSGVAANAVVAASLRTQAAGSSALNAASAGTILRHAPTATAPAALTAGTFPLNLDPGDTLTITLAGGPGTVSRSASFRNKVAASLTATFAEPTGAGSGFRLAVNGAAEVVVSGDFLDTAAVVAAIQAALTAAGQAGEVNVTSGGIGSVTLTTTDLGSGASLAVFSPTLFTFADMSASGSGNVTDINAVTSIEVLTAFSGSSGFTVTAPGGVLTVSVTDSAYTGPGATLTLSGDAPALARFGAVTLSSAGTGAATTFYRKDAAGVWQGLVSGTFDPATAVSSVDTIVSLNLEVSADGVVQYYEDLGLDSLHPRYLPTVLAETPESRRDRLSQLVWFDPAVAVTTANMLAGILGGGASATFTLTGGTDGVTPSSETAWEDALATLNRREDISMVASPGYTAFAPSLAASIQDALITHAEGRRVYRVAILDTPDGLTPNEAAEWRGRVDTTRAAMYYPWIVTSNPNARTGDATQPREINVPPSGSLAGVYARTDILRGVFKAPANEVVRGALRFEYPVNFAEQELLNPLGVNCLRFFPGRGYRVWGARTSTSDPEWKYINVRRYFLYLEASIERGTQWAVFEPNGERLWANIRETIDAFLFNEWKNGALLGGSPKEAYFVRCDRSTMTQNDIDNGRLVCLIGVAPLRPAEFVIFRIGQKTADARD
jgi:phage tail sheath protein FI